VLSTKPYLIRALWSWCCDAGFTPYLTVFVDEHCRVPLDYVQDGSITLNLSPSATGQLDLGNEWITLSARFGGVPRELMFPIGAVVGIFARENGAGMEFAYESTVTPASAQSIVEIKPVSATADTKPDTAGKPGRPPHLQRIK
jgi:stringent starvation protein B